MKTVFVIVFLSALAGAAHAQGEARQPGETTALFEAPEYDRPVLARSYANGFGRRLANTILLFIDQRSVLRNLPLLGYRLGNVRDTDCGRMSGFDPAIPGEVALVRETHVEGRYFGSKFDFPGPKVRRERVCDWAAEPRKIFERSSLYVFDIMGGIGEWTFAGEGAPPEDWRPFMAGRIERGPFGAAGDFVRWTVEPGNRHAYDEWALAWTAPEADSGSARKAAVGSTLWWRYETVSSFPEADASEDVSIADPGVGLSFPNGAAIDSSIATVGSPSASAMSYYMSYSATASRFGNGTISKCGIGFAGEAPCSMNWRRAPVPDPSEETGEPVFSLWYDAGGHGAGRHAEPGRDWYVLTGEPLLAESAGIWVERSAFR